VLEMNYVLSFKCSTENFKNISSLSSSGLVLLSEQEKNKNKLQNSRLVYKNNFRFIIIMIYVFVVI